MTRTFTAADLAAINTRNKARKVRLEVKDGRGAGKYRKPKVLEREVLRACIDLLAVHPKVALAYRVNTGAMRIDDRYVKFGAKGTPDIVGVLKGGRALYVEVKRPGKMPSPEQNAFLYAVNQAGGFACWVDSADKLNKLLKVV